MSVTMVTPDGGRTKYFIDIDFLIGCLRDLQNSSYCTAEYEKEYVCLEKVIDSLYRIEADTKEAAGIE